MRRLFTKISHYYILALVFMLGLILFLPDSGYDKYFWVTWAQYIKEHGLADAYNNPEINYHPIILFIIKGFTLFVDTPNYTNINRLKIPTALFDWGIIFIALKLMQKHKVNLQWGLLLAFNPAFWYNTIIWGQFDSIWIFFTLLSFYYAKNNFHFSTLAFILALNTKLFALLFLPFLVLLWIKNRYSSNKQTIVSIGIAVVLQTLLILPFLFSTHHSLSTIISRSTEYYNSASRNAYNIWYYFFDNPVTTNDADYLLLAAAVVAFAFIALLYFQYKQKISVWQSVALASLIFFLFLTRMHERYAHVALVFSFVAALNSPPNVVGVTRLWRGEGVRIVAFLLISLAYLLNLEAVMQMINKSLGIAIDYNSIIFNPKLISTLYVISLVLLVISTFVSQKQLSERA